MLSARTSSARREDHIDRGESDVDASDVFEFKRKVGLYEEKTGRKASRLVIVTPYAEEEAIKASKELGIEMYTKV